ncbi:potassium channel family protein [Amycolatopsis sp. YIM 10]|uniref:potassium channel protein n=1 Tax=Amycolatopsis sp. YIM 10 TaxID=2653857 RepID=UPI0012904CF3|nr:potassium channel family protein [Amycolatopsis sp. YIM 10]QFU91507.1 Voltage-gated potassium channel Kch [Amycolatopsis sp. YIM 10]
MPVFLLRLIRRALGSRVGLPPLAVVLFVFVTSWPLMLLAEPAGSELIQPANFWWWFVVTASTVGYGDFYPESTWGHVVGAYVIIGGIATLTTLFAQLASMIEKRRGRRMHGSGTLEVADHVVVLGYTPGRTERILDELHSDPTLRLVLAAWPEVETNPLPERTVEFVRGDLTTENTLRRACAHRARAVLIDARDDNEALAVAVTVDHLQAAAHVVVALRDLDRANHFRYVSESIHCVQWHNPHMLTEELQDPGITQVYEEIMTHGGTGNTYSLRLPEATAFGDCQIALGREHNATALAARTPESLLVSPSWDTVLPVGSVLYFVCRRRISEAQLSAALRLNKV